MQIGPEREPVSAVEKFVAFMLVLDQLTCPL
jgi:hypothetical protein